MFISLLCNYYKVSECGENEVSYVKVSHLALVSLPSTHMGNTSLLTL